MFGSFGLVPQLIHFLERRPLGGLAAIRERAFDRRKTAREFMIGGAQHRFRIGTEVARKVDHREQEIADLRRGRRAIACRQLALDLVRLFTDLGEHRAGIVPIEADFARLGL